MSYQGFTLLFWYAHGNVTPHPVPPCPKCCTLAVERLPYGSQGEIRYVCLECGHTFAHSPRNPIPPPKASE